MDKNVSQAIGGGEGCIDDGRMGAFGISESGRLIIRREEGNLRTVIKKIAIAN